MDRRYHGTWLLLIVALGAVVAGCVRRRLTIRTNPPGALVYVDNYEVGRTPCSTDFTYYGTRQIKLVKDGYETLTVNQPIPTPWYEIPPIDFVSENLVPGQVRDERLLSYNLTPQVLLPADQLRSRAESLRGGARASGPIVPIPVAPADGGAPVPAGLPPPAPPDAGRELLPPPAPSAPIPAPTAPGPLSPRPETLPPRGTPPIYAPPLLER